MLSVALDFTRDTCLFDFKNLVAAKEGVRTEQVHLTIGGKEYPDTKKLMLVAHLDFVLKLAKVMLVLLVCSASPWGYGVPVWTSTCIPESVRLCTLLHDGVCLQGPVSHFT